MPHIFPEKLTDQFSGAKASGERRVYDKLAEALGKDWYVFHDLKWNDSKLGDDQSIGQADFVIVHPEFGWLVLEVKGGRCSYSAADRVWETVNGDHQRAEIKDPFDQAAAGARVIGKLLLHSPLSDKMYIPHGQSAVLFPDCTMPKHRLRGDVPDWKILDQDDLFNISAGVNRLFDAAFPDERLERMDGLQLIGELKRLWGVHDAEGRTRLNLRIQESFERLVALTDQQRSVLKSLSQARFLQVTGCAGSGKTTLAVHKARTLADAGQRVGLFCFNIPLAGHLSRECSQHDNVTVGPIAELCQQWLTDAGVSLRKEDTSTWWDETLPNLVVDNLDRIPHRFDAIVVDEGQDIRENYWTVIELLLADPETATFYIFADQGQNIYRGKMNLSIDVMPFSLNQNIRNTNQVFEVVKACCGLSDDITPSGVSGPKPELYRYENEEDMLQQLNAIIERLCNESVHPSDIAILGTRSQARTCLKYGEKIGAFRLAQNQETGTDLRCMTVHKFKGLEAKVIILCELDDQPPNIDDLLYIGMTRSTGMVIALATGEMYKRLRKAGFERR